MSVYAYVRVSTARQAEEGESLDAQERKLKGYALQQGWELEQILRDEGISGSVPLERRPAGELMLASLQRGDVIMATRLDRMFRSALDALQTVKGLTRLGVDLHLLDLGGSVVRDGAARLFFTMVSAFAEFERERIGERIRDIKDDQRQRGRYLGGIRPLGYRIGPDGELVPNQSEMKLVRQILKLNEQGLALRAIADQVSTPARKVSYSTVRRILQRMEVRG